MSAAAAAASSQLLGIFGRKICSLCFQAALAATPGRKNILIGPLDWDPVTFQSSASLLQTRAMGLFTRWVLVVSVPSDTQTFKMRYEKKKKQKKGKLY